MGSRANKSPSELNCCGIIDHEPLSEIQQRCDDYIAESVSQLWLLAPGIKRAYVATKTEGLRECKDLILRIGDPALELDLKRIFD